MRAKQVSEFHLFWRIMNSSTFFSESIWWLFFKADADAKENTRMRAKRVSEFHLFQRIMNNLHFFSWAIKQLFFKPDPNEKQNTRMRANSEVLWIVRVKRASKFCFFKELWIVLHFLAKAKQEDASEASFRVPFILKNYE